MAVHHIRKDGRRADTVSGVVIKEKDFENLYTIIEAISNREERK